MTIRPIGDTVTIGYAADMTVRIVDLGNLIRRKRERLGWSQATLAEKLGTTQAAVSAWESGRHKPQDLAKVRGVLGIKPSEYRTVLVAERDDPVIAALSAATTISAAVRDALLTLYRIAAQAHRTNDEK